MRYFILFFLLVSVSAAGQTLQGEVTDSAGHSLAGVTVLNVHTEQGTTTSDEGFYSLGAAPGDVISFSSVGYKTVKKIRPATVMVATTNVVLEAAAYQLKEFKLGNSTLTPYQADSVARASLYKKTLDRSKPSAFNSPVSSIAEAFNKKAKESYRFQEEFAEGETQKFIDTRYTPGVVAAVTGFTGDTIGHFMYAYPMPYDFARAATDLEIKMWIRNNYKEWIKKDSGVNADGGGK